MNFGEIVLGLTIKILTFLWQISYLWLVFLSHIELNAFSIEYDIIFIVFGGRSGGISPQQNTVCLRLDKEIA